MRDPEQIAADALTEAAYIEQCLAMKLVTGWVAEDASRAAKRLREAAEALRHTPDARLIDGANKATRLREEAVAERDALKDELEILRAAFTAADE